MILLLLMDTFWLWATVHMAWSSTCLSLQINLPDLPVNTSTRPLTSVLAFCTSLPLRIRQFLAADLGPRHGHWAIYRYFHQYLQSNAAVCPQSGEITSFHIPSTSRLSVCDKWIQQQSSLNNHRRLKYNIGQSGMLRPVDWYCNRRFGRTHRS